MPNLIDVNVGRRVRHRRTPQGLGQEKLGEALRFTFKQGQNYERSANRIGAGRLFDMARVLDEPIPLFFEDLADGDTAQAANASGLLTKRETLELLRAYYKISDSAIRKRLFNLARSLSY